MRQRCTRARKGAVLVTVLILVIVVAVVLSSLTWQSVTQRRILAQREHQLQAEWLARGGVEHVRASLATGNWRASQTWTPLPDAEVKIDVTEKDGTYQVRSEATFPAGDPRPVSRVQEATIAAKK